MKVKDLEKILRNYDSETEIHTRCDNCHHGSNRDISILDSTNQTYGYVEIILNETIKSKIECSKDEKEFYEKEISKLENTVKRLKEEIALYEDFIEGVGSQSRILNKRLGWIK